MANVTANEQLMLELVNRARLDPVAEAARLGIDLNQGLTAGTITADAKQPLAFNTLLITAARNHSTWQLDHDLFQHEGAGNNSPGDRMTAAGYVFTGLWRWGENIARSGVSGQQIDPAVAIVEQHEGLFKSALHRNNLLGDRFKEIGIGQEIGTFTLDGVDYSTSMLTQDLAATGTQSFLTGVIYQDTNGDHLYGLGEGLGLRQVQVAPGGTVQTNAFGGYETILATGLNRVTLQGSSPVVVDLTVTDQNVKIDLADGIVRTSASLTLVSGATVAELLGVAPNALAGSAAAERLVGNRGANRLAGNGGADTLDGGLGADTLDGGTGNDTFLVDQAGDQVIELAGAGTDTVRSTVTYTLTPNVEHLILSGTAAIDGTGNALGNAITGNAAANRLRGLAGNDTLDGGLGADTLEGGAGDDTYLIDHAADQVIELAGEGSDRVRTSLSYTLSDQCRASAPDRHRRRAGDRERAEQRLDRQWRCESALRVGGRRHPRWRCGGRYPGGRGWQ